jgi:hypothetical protein
MKLEDKELLLKDLSGRLPYGVICYWRIGSELTLNLTEYNGQLTGINKVEIEDSDGYYYDCYFNVCNDSNGNSFQNEDVPIEIVKPYLRPMSSMTEEEEDLLSDFNCYYTNGSLFFSCGHTQEDVYNAIDWLNAHHFDYRGLIEKGLALEATEGMYKNK